MGPSSTPSPSRTLWTLHWDGEGPPVQGIFWDFVHRSNVHGSNVGSNRNRLQPSPPFFQTLQGKLSWTLGNECPAMIWFWRQWCSPKPKAFLKVGDSWYIGNVGCKTIFSLPIAVWVCDQVGNVRSINLIKRDFPAEKKQTHSIFAGLMMSQCHVGSLPWQVHMHVMTFVLLFLTVMGLMGFFAATMLIELFAARGKLSTGSSPKACHFNEFAAILNGT